MPRSLNDQISEKKKKKYPKNKKINEKETEKESLIYHAAAVVNVST